MASPSRRSPRDLNAELRADASQFGFFQAVRLLGLAAHKRGERRGALPAKLRFRTLATLSFPPSELVRYRPEQQETPAVAPVDEMAVSFIGMTGPSGALPTHYTELLIERRQQYRDTSLHAFLDLFSHRATALFYGAWRKYRYWIGVEAGEQDGFTRNLLDLGGVGLSQLRGQLGDEVELDENLFLYYAGLLNQKPLSAQALETLVEGFFGVRARLEQFVGRWMNVPADEQSRLGGQACELGVAAFAGDRIWDRQTKLRLTLGPLRSAQFDAMQPGGPGAVALKALLQFALGHSLAADVTLMLDRIDVPPARLANDNGLRLGGNCWLGPQASDPDDMRYELLH
ncbi:type VI secretion system baseplate subunit TssG [Crenobacter sp. SG2305]|uniref:type VI secretion system baseplate subunit TssG n=1 Tax=Crenobacter oryzisoli TaxID=3056844 RepID=UPI0025AAB3E3|nr:type VI secretion system baseplate subunit TssG [Crenobacter sp. SG2305]MDN0083421.1 type VI secretion system baseplate subunit TssG [Crenobacter sp. SG2305]